MFYCATGGKPAEAVGTKKTLIVFLDKLSDVLDEVQKNKLKNNLQAFRKSGKIEPKRKFSICLNQKKFRRS